MVWRAKGVRQFLVGQWKVRCRKFGAESLLWSKVEMQVERNGSMFLGFSRAKDGMEKVLVRSEMSFARRFGSTLLMDQLSFKPSGLAGAKRLKFRRKEKKKRESFGAFSAENLFQ